MRRVIASLAVVGIMLAPRAAAAGSALVFADRDDDDGDTIADGAQPIVPDAPELFSIPRARSGGVVRATSGADRARLVVNGKPVAWGAKIPVKGAIAVQGLRAGAVEIDAFGARQRLAVVEMHAFDDRGHEVDLARSHASIERTPPERLDEALARSDDPDALRFVFAGDADDLPRSQSFFSYSQSGAVIDALRDVPLERVGCPSSIARGLSCASTPPLRAVPDDVDRNHPVVQDRSIKAELGGAIAAVDAKGDKLQMIRVGGPRESSIGAIDRYRAKLRVRLVRLAAHGPPPIGGDEAGALASLRAEIARANSLWGSCGVSFGDEADVDVKVVDPPRPSLLSLGCDEGLPASGGAVRFKVDGKEVSARIDARVKPRGAARVVAAAIAAAGFVAKVSDNPATVAGAFGSSDLLVKRRDGQLATLEPSSHGPLSSDATMTACIGKVDLEDGLQHFGDIDAVAGTLEERALVKAFSDDDPSTIDVFVVPSFAGGGRIGESFISADGGAIRNVVLEDRAGFRADRASFALAHELGHVLLDDPGHPDDFGVDTPTRLMDADAANSTAYGPRRLLVDECVRAIRQSGPSAPIPLLRPWPLGKISLSKPR